MTQASNLQDGDSHLPHWIRDDVDFERFPAELRAAIVEVIVPAYRQLVEQAREGLEKSAGLTIVWLMWLEMVDHIQLTENFTTPRSVAQVSEEREQLINRHLRLVGSKVKASAFLVRLHEFEQKHGSMPGCSGSVGASPGPATDEAEEVEG
jgi:hypothetical protein